MSDPRALEPLSFETAEATASPRPMLPWEDDLDATPRALPAMAGAAIANNLPRRRRFVGRDEEIAALDDALARGEGMASLHGLAGAGKTAVALEYAHRAVERRAYSGGVWWLAADGAPAEALAKLYASLRAAAPQALKAALASPSAGTRTSELATYVRLALQSQRAPTLLVLDGVDAPGWRAILPGGDVRVIATARDDRLALGVRVAVGALTTAHARELAIALAGKPAGDGEAKALDRVVADGLGGLALAVEIAARAVVRWAHAWSEYERCMYSDADAILEEREPQGDYPDSVLSALDRSIDGCARGTWARRLLEAAAVFAPDDVPLQWAASAAQGDFTSLETKRAIALLSGLGLARGDDEARTLSIHRLVHRRVRERAEPDDWIELNQRGAACVAAWLEEKVDPTRTLEVEARRAHLVEALAAAERGGGDLDWVTIADRLGAHMRHLALYPEARSLLERAVARAERLDPPSPPRLAESLSALASLLRDLGEAAAARPHLERALVIDEQVHGPTHPAVARDLQSLAAVLKELGKVAEAKPLLERALAIDEETSGADHPSTAKTLSTLAAVLKDMGKMAEAKPLLERALAIEEKVFGPDHPSSVVRLTNLAMMLKDMGQAAEAKPLLERALVILEGTYGPEHPIVATSLTNLALVLKDVGHPGDAKPLLSRAHRIAEKTLPQNHPTRTKIAAHLAHTVPPPLPPAKS